MNRVVVAKELVKLAKELMAGETDELTGWPIVHSRSEIPPKGTPFIGLLGRTKYRQILKEVPFRKGLNKQEPVYVFPFDAVGFRAVKTDEEMGEQRIFIEPVREYKKALRSKE